MRLQDAIWNLEATASGRSTPPKPSHVHILLVGSGRHALVGSIRTRRIRRAEPLAASRRFYHREFQLRVGGFPLGDPYADDSLFTVVQRETNVNPGLILIGGRPFLVGMHHFWREHPPNNGTGLLILGQEGHCHFARAEFLVPHGRNWRSHS